MKINGRVWKFGDHVDTDLIIPARYLNVSDEGELARNCFADVRPDFARDVKEGDIVVAGVNFGCGSSREHAPVALKAAGIRVVIARSFARIFYRNAFNIGLPVLDLPVSPDFVNEGETLSVDLATGEIQVRDRGEALNANPVIPFMRRIIDAGGLVAYIRENGTF